MNEMKKCHPMKLKYLILKFMLLKLISNYLLLKIEHCLQIKYHYIIKCLILKFMLPKLISNYLLLKIKPCLQIKYYYTH